jgi:RNA polymerase sigma-70 factor, ECF subfamily
LSEPPDDVQKLVERLKRGDKEALGELFALHEERLRRLIELRLDGRLRGRLSQSDILQDTYIDAQKRLAHYLSKPDMPFHLWLRLVAGQRIVEVHRQHLAALKRDAGRETPLYGSVPEASSVCLAGILFEQLETPSQVAMKRESLMQLEAALEGMDPIDREILALRHFEELSNDDVADVLNLQKSAASNRYVRALKRLRDVLQPEKPPEGKG